MRRDEENKDVSSWRPRDGQGVGVNHDSEQEHLDSHHREAVDRSKPSAEKGGDRWLNRDFYSSNGEGYRAIGSSFVREVDARNEAGTNADESRDAKPWRAREATNESKEA